MTKQKDKPAMRLRTTGRAEKAVQAAYGLARSEGESLAGSRHLLLALVQMPGDFSTLLLEHLGVAPADVIRELARRDEDITGTDAPPEVNLDPTEQAWAHNRAGLLDPAREAAQRLGDPRVSTEHLLLGLLREEAAAGRALRRLGVTWERAEAALPSLPRGEGLVPEVPPPPILTPPTLTPIGV